MPGPGLEAHTSYARNMGVTEPDADFLAGLRSLCDKQGALLVFEEVKTGMKIARGGATEHYKEHGLTAYANGVGSMGTINFKNARMRDYRDGVTLDKRASAAFRLAMTNEGIIPQPPGPDEQWTITVQHTEPADSKYKLRVWVR